MRELSNSGGQENLSQGLIRELPFSFPRDIDPAIPYRADEENRPHLARSPYPAAQLFQGQEAVFQRCDRGAQQQGQSNHEKILWFSHLPHPGTRALSLTWQTTPAGAYP